MMMSSTGNLFHVTGPLWGESTGDRWIPLTKAREAELWCFLWSMPEQTVEQTIEMLVILNKIIFDVCKAQRYPNDLLIFKNLNHEIYCPLSKQFAYMLYIITILSPSAHSSSGGYFDIKVLCMTAIHEFKCPLFSEKLLRYDITDMTHMNICFIMIIICFCFSFTNHDSFILLSDWCITVIFFFFFAMNIQNFHGQHLSIMCTQMLRYCFLLIDCIYFPFFQWAYKHILICSQASPLIWLHLTASANCNPEPVLHAALLCQISLIWTITQN